PDANPDAETDANANADAKANADADANANADTDTNTNADANADTERWQSCDSVCARRSADSYAGAIAIAEPALAGIATTKTPDHAHVRCKTNCAAANST
ncbi:MAG: hypothetical protein JOZ01_05440, partial [Candidatus Eremiobacteraeota bacterium]|nr:hypothetical protein [Candidatus Eremiobacteraeota bacterium]